MEILQAIVLGVVQGLTEFLPISSQAHLYLVPYLAGWDYQGLGFDVALHWGTLLAVVTFFWKDYWRFLTKDRIMIWYLILGNIPAIIAGLILRPYAEHLFRSPIIMVVTLVGFGALMWYADKKSRSRTTDGTETKLDWKTVLLIGCAQAIAIVPGTSRSGITLTAALLFSTLNREQAARFSFILSGPIVFGAGLVELPTVSALSMPIIVGFIAAAVSGALTIRLLLSYLAKRGLAVFAWYRFALAAVVLAVLLWR